MNDPWKDPHLWEDRISSYRSANDLGLKDAIKFAAWYAGDLATLRARVSDLLGGEDVAPLSNHININTQAALSELMFRSPRYLATPQPHFGPPFGDKLARIETRNLNDWVDESDFFGEGRMTLLDGLLSPMMVFEVGYCADIGVDDELLAAERAHAQNEDLAILGGGKPRVLKDDYHPAHIEQHDRTIADIEKGLLPATAGVLRYLKKHRKFHEDAATKDGARPLETVRQESVFGERVSMLTFACDMAASMPSRRRWVGKWILRSVAEVRANKRYNYEARRKVEAADLSQLGGDVVKKALRVTGEQEHTEDMALLFEGIDLQQGKKVLFAQGADKCLIDTDYRDWRILPSGPYVTGSFVTDPVNGCGVAPPRIYEGHQEMVSYTDTLIAASGRRSVPMMAGVGNYLTPEEVERIQAGIPAAFIQLKKIPPGMSLEQVIQRIPMPEASEFLFSLRALHERGAERYSGIGSAKSGGGDFSRTATASAIVNDAVQNLADDRRAVWDDMMSRIGRYVVRLQRKRYTNAKVMEVAGLEAADPDGWPIWSDRDISRDKGVSVIHGSSRRKDSAVELKLNTELLTVVAPFLPPPMIMELVKRVLDSAGVYSLDTSMLDQAAMMQDIQQTVEGGGGDEQQETQPGRRAKEKGEGSQAAVNQGAQNVGGGRVPTGASNGDRRRLMR